LTEKPVSGNHKTSRIAFVVSSMAGGGAERVVALLANHFTSIGIDVCICCIEKEYREVAYELDSRIKLVFINRGDRPKITGKLWQLAQLRRTLLGFHPDVIVGIMSYNAVQSIIAARFTHIPVVYNIVTTPERDPATKRERFLVHLFFRFAKGAVYHTPHQQQYFKSYDNGIYDFILNPVQAEIIKGISNNKKKKQIITAGRLIEVKNHPLLIRAFASIASHIPEYSLEIYGDGPNRVALLSLIDDLHMSGRINIHPFTDNIFHCMAESELFVLSSIDEGLGSALIEAMCLGLPCITTDYNSGGAHVLIADGVDGVIVPNRDEKALAAAILDLLADTEKAKKIGENAKKIIDRVEVPTVAEQWLDLFERVI
jgi:glycosyltransferase involved in cell wall biosynthesis